MLAIQPTKKIMKTVGKPRLSDAPQNVFVFATTKEDALFTAACEKNLLVTEPHEEEILSTF